MSSKEIIINNEGIAKALTRISHEIIERNEFLCDVALVGIQRRGVPMAKRLADIIYDSTGILVPVGILDITFYRDDLSLLSEHPVINGTDIDFTIDGKNIILIDDVLFSGRTARAGIDGLFDLGRASSVQLVALVDRGHRELPIRADYVGINISSPKETQIDVCLTEIDGVDEVVLHKIS